MLVIVLHAELDILSLGKIMKISIKVKPLELVHVATLVRIQVVWYKIVEKDSINNLAALLAIVKNAIVRVLNVAQLEIINVQLVWIDMSKILTLVCVTKTSNKHRQKEVATAI